MTALPVGSIELVSGPLSAVETEVLAVPVFQGDDLTDLGDLVTATAGELARALAAGEFTGKLYEMLWCTVRGEGWRPTRAFIVGAGPRVGFSADRLRKVAATVSLVGRQRRFSRLAFLVRGDFDATAGIQAAAEGLTLGEFTSAQHKTVDLPGPAPALVVVHAEAGRRDLPEVVARGRVLGECCNLARSLVSEPANVLTPRVLADRAREIAGSVGATVEILAGPALADLKMELLLGVARGSAEPPTLIVLRHDPPTAPERPVLGLVGKGVTFDTGGISLKPADGMERMKGDMAGGAAVICALRAVSLLGAPIRVVGVVPTTENMPGGRAIKPGDVLRSASGKTVEVVNTDAEGRLILADALWYAQQLGATHLVDVATLTGACVTALGRITSGLFGTPGPWAEHVRSVADRVGDRAWLMPVFEEYAELLRSEVADLVNSAERAGGAITAAMFLKEFTGGLPWVHLDIAGTAWLADAKPFQAKGPTGVAVRTLAELAFTSADWPV